MSFNSSWGEENGPKSQHHQHHTHHHHQQQQQPPQQHQSQSMVRSYSHDTNMMLADAAVSKILIVIIINFMPSQSCHEY